MQHASISLACRLHSEAPKRPMVSLMSGEVAGPSKLLFSSSPMPPTPQRRQRTLPPPTVRSSPFPQTLPRTMPYLVATSSLGEYAYSLLTSFQQRRPLTSFSQHLAPFRRRRRSHASGCSGHHPAQSRLRPCIVFVLSRTLPPHSRRRVMTGPRSTQAATRTEKAEQSEK